MKELRRLFTLSLCTIVLLLCCAGAFAQGGIQCYTTWDEFYIYFAFQVDDSDITGKHATPNSKPWQDDSIEVFLEANNKHATNRTSSTVSMSVSAAGGSGFTFGVNGKPEQKSIFSYKYAQTLQGTLNDSDDTDIGYQVEMAIPWQEIGVIPKPGMMMSFNIVCRMKGDQDKMISMSPAVKAEADVQNPSKWSDIVLTAPTFGAATLNLQKIVCARYVSKRPMIDGRLSLKEYNKNTSFNFTAPEAPGEYAKKKPKRSLQKLVMARYLYNYQADPRRGAPAVGVRREDGSCMLTDFPAFAAGPWFSADRVEWHKQELTEMRNTGIDVVMPVYRGDKKSKAEYSVKGLDTMVQALRELRNEKKDYPLIGLFFDTECLAVSDGANFNLTSDPVKKSLYGMIKDFFQRVPVEFRAQAQIADDRAGYPNYILFLGPAGSLKAYDDSFIQYINDRFAKDFNARLTWILPSDLKSKCQKPDGFCGYPGGVSLKYDESGLIRVASVGPGYDNATVASAPVLRSRNNGEAYKKDWGIIDNKKPNWILIDSWNDLSQGSNICGTRQYGFGYADMTAMAIGKMRAVKEYDAKILTHNTPKVIEPGRFYQVNLQVRNDGSKAWSVAEGYVIGYKWYKDGRPVEEGAVKRPIQKDVLPGKTAEITVGLSAVIKENQPLPEGDYEVHFEFLRMSDNRWFSLFGDEPFVVPVTIGKPTAMAARFVSADFPSMIKTGGDYTVSVRVRNDGSETWSKDKIKVGCRLWKVSNFTSENKVDAEHPVDAVPVLLALEEDVAPGDEVTLQGVFTAKDSQGQPLPEWSPSETSSYIIRWQLMGETDWIADAGSYDQAVGIYSSDPGAQFLATDIPASLTANKTYDVKVMLKNRGTESWTPEKNAIGYHWYYADGTEAQWDCPVTKLKKPILPAKNPGDVEFVTIKVTAPAHDGQYILMWDLKDGDNWASTAPITHGGDSVPVFVEVKDGKLSFVDMSKLYDLVASSPDNDTASGDFDGKGGSFAAEMLPPDVPASKLASTVYPSGYYRSPAQSGPDSQRKISFNYGPKATGQKNAVACAGQAVEIKPGNYAALHILGAAVEPDANGKLGIVYESGTEKADITMTSWTQAPKHSEQIGFMSMHTHKKDGDNVGAKGYLHHMTIKLDPSRKLTGITLPANSKMRVVAVTLEK